MHLYLGTFLIAFATLALEITLARLLSAITWYHLAFLAVSTAMLGMTAGAAYFCLIGCGFMLAEIGLIQRLSVFLGHPVYALGILLFTLIASTGIGSMLSERLPLTRKPWMVIYPLVTAAGILGLRFALKPILAAYITEDIMVKIVVTVVMLFPLGIVMGFFFPTGMKVARETAASETPWYWALNGVFGVLCSALAVFISIYVSISTNFYIAAACYALTAVMILRMRGNATPAG